MPEAERAAILSEIRTHLVEADEELREHIPDRDERLAHILASFGDPYVLAAAMEARYQPWWHKLGRLLWPASLGTFALAHLVAALSMVVFATRAGGYPLDWWMVWAYGGISGLAVLLAAWHGWREVRQQRSLPMLAATLHTVPAFLALFLWGMFYATENVPGGAEWSPYLDDDGAFASANIGLSCLALIVALIARSRLLLAVWVTGHGLLLIGNPGLVLPALQEFVLWGELVPLLVVPALYAGAGVILRFPWRQVLQMVGLFAVLAFPIVAVASANVFRYVTDPSFIERPTLAQYLASHVDVMLSSWWFWVAVMPLPLYGWRFLRSLHAADIRLPHPALSALLLTLPSLLASWVRLERGASDSGLPNAGKDMGWLGPGRTLPSDVWPWLMDLVPLLLGLSGALLLLLMGTAIFAQIGPRRRGRIAESDGGRL